MSIYRLLILRIGTFAFVGLLSLPAAFGQPFGNEWISPNKTWFKITLAERGIYRLTYQQLSAAGVPLASVDARRIQLFHRGVEQAIYLQGEEDGRLDATDYIEFYGEPADGAADTGLYREPAAQPHTYYNLFSDTAAYFLTWHLSSERGKRMSNPVPEVNVDNLPPEPYHSQEILLLQTSNYSQGRTYEQGDIILSQYDFGEGWTGPDIPKTTNQQLSLTGISNTVTTGPAPQLEVLLVGRNNLQHKVDIYVGPSAGGLRLWQTSEFAEHDPSLVSGEISWSDISAGGELFVRANVVGVSDAADRAAISYVRLVYPQSLSMSGANSKILQLRENTANKSFVRLSNVSAAVSLYDISNPDHVNRIGIQLSGTDLTAVVNNTSAGKRLLAVSSPLSSYRISQVSLLSFDPATTDYLIITHSALRQSTTSGNGDPVLAYKSYRESAAGGAHKVAILEIDDVFNLFNYGEVSPLAIRRLGAWWLARGTPQFLFLVGKGTTPNANYYRLSDPGFLHYLPTFGTPGSDVAFLAGLGGTSYESPIPIGRLNARTPDDVEAYLNKVVEMESTPFTELWRKNLIHLSGGATTSELARFRRYVDGFKKTAEGKYLGGRVVTASKSTSNAVEFINIANEVNQGVSMITFFGHSGSFSTDIDIGNVSNPGFGYANKGKYPVLLVNGCDAGNIFANVYTFGEDWTLTPNLGALGCVAHSYKGFSPDLREFSDNVYTTAFADSVFIGRSFGEVLAEASARYLSDATRITERQITQVQQMVFQGDPAIKIFGAGKPDYQVDAESFDLLDADGNILTVAKDTFAVRVIVRNFGIAADTPVKIALQWRREDGSTGEYSMEKQYVLRQDTLHFGISNAALLGEGANVFQVFVDPEGKIDELDESNNTASQSIFLSKGTTIHLFPMDKGTSGPEAKLVIQTTNLLSPVRSCEIEMDTVPSFDSPYLKRFSEQMKVIFVKTVNLESSGALPDSSVVYWRSRFLNPQPGEDTSWVTSSFTLLHDSPGGFAMTSANQFSDAELTGLELDVRTFNWSFPENNTSLEIKTHGGSRTDLGKADIDVQVGGTELLVETTGFNVCRNNTFNAIALDRQSTVPYPPVQEWSVFNNQLTCGVTPKRINNFTNDEMFHPTAANGGTRRLSQFIDAVPEGDYIVFFNIGTVQYSRWDAEVKQKLKQVGIRESTLNSLSDGQPVIFFGRKGATEGTAVEVVGDGSATPLPEQQIALSDVIEGRYFSGSLASGKVGPARAWQSMSHSVKLGATQTADNYFMDVVGLRRDGGSELLLSNVTAPAVDLSGIDAAEYPFLRLFFTTRDESNLQPVQLRSWFVGFEPQPEGVLLTHEPALRGSRKISGNEGERLTIPFTFFNVSQSSFTDSLHVAHTTMSQETDIQQTISFKLPPLASGDSAQFLAEINTVGKEGLNDLRVSVDGGAELISNNNRLFFPGLLEVKADKVNPTLEVTFDGNHILNGDIVAPDPVVNIRLTDDYPYLLKQDTIGMEVFLKAPCDACEFERVSFSSGKMRWAADTAKNEVSVEYRPGPLEDGVYTLRVTAADASGNQAGTAPYEISFEVINESTISHFYPYPNPFSTSTRFVFTLTGAILPDQLKIQIMTISGRIVREITQDEIGPLKIGNNITEFAWDGTDEFGDQLANGVYLYRVMVRMNGRPMEHRTTSADKAFKNGFGKMYLLR